MEYKPSGKIIHITPAPAAEVVIEEVKVEEPKVEEEVKVEEVTPKVAKTSNNKK